MTEPTIELPPLAAPVDELWRVLLDLGEQLTVGWTLIGGQMVLLHALEHGRVPPQISQDADVVADVRAGPSLVRDVVAALGAVGFEPNTPSANGIAHRYSRPAEPRPVVLDVLGPEGLPDDTQLLVTAPPNRTIEVPGGTQALARTETVTVVHEGRVGHLPRPTLLAALVLKAAASGVDHDPARHLRDLALLCALVEDPFEMRERLTRKDLRRLRHVAALHDPAHPAWALVPEDIRSDGHAALAILTA